MTSATPPPNRPPLMKVRLTHQVARARIIAVPSNHGPVAAAAAKIGQKVANEPVASPPLPTPPPSATVLKQLAEQLAASSLRTQEEQNETVALAIELATTIVERMFTDALAADQVNFQPLVEELLGQCGKSRPVELTLHPDDLSILQAGWKESPPPWVDEEIEWRSDPTLARGNGRAEHHGAGWILDWRGQMAEMRAALWNQAEASAR